MYSTSTISHFSPPSVLPFFLFLILLPGYLILGNYANTGFIQSPTPLSSSCSSCTHHIIHTSTVSPVFYSPSSLLSHQFYHVSIFPSSLLSIFPLLYIYASFSLVPCLIIHVPSFLHTFLCLYLIANSSLFFLPLKPLAIFNLSQYPPFFFGFFRWLSYLSSLCYSFPHSCSLITLLQLEQISFLKFIHNHSPPPIAIPLIYSILPWIPQLYPSCQTPYAFLIPRTNCLSTIQKIPSSSPVLNSIPTHMPSWSLPSIPSIEPYYIQTPILWLLFLHTDDSPSLSLSLLFFVIFLSLSPYIPSSSMFIWYLSWLSFVCLCKQVCRS